MTAVCSCCHVCTGQTTICSYMTFLRFSQYSADILISVLKAIGHIFASEQIFTSHRFNKQNIYFGRQQNGAVPPKHWPLNIFKNDFEFFGLFDAATAGILFRAEFTSPLPPQKWWTQLVNCWTNSWAAIVI